MNTLYLPADPEVDAARKRAAHEAAMHANDISIGELLFLPLVLVAGAISALLSFAGAVLVILGTWVLIAVGILFFILLWRS